jgi:endonuclease YncB( thermonuclease family)
MQVMLQAVMLLCANPQVTDGDSIRCGDGTRLRLSGIEAPDKPAYCRKHKRVCTIEEWRKSKETLRQQVGTGPVRYVPLVTDFFQRQVAIVYNSSGVNLSCSQLTAGSATYVAKWDNGGGGMLAGEVKRRCAAKG